MSGQRGERSHNSIIIQCLKSSPVLPLSLSLSTREVSAPKQVVTWKTSQDAKASIARCPVQVDQVPGTKKMVNTFRPAKSEQPCIKENPIITQSTGKQLESPTSNAALMMEKKPIDQTHRSGTKKKAKNFIVNQAKPETRQTESATARTCDCVLQKRHVFKISVLALAATSTNTTSGE